MLAAQVTAFVPLALVGVLAVILFALYAVSDSLGYDAPTHMSKAAVLVRYLLRYPNWVFEWGLGQPFDWFYEPISLLSWRWWRKSLGLCGGLQNHLVSLSSLLRHFFLRPGSGLGAQPESGGHRCGVLFKRPTYPRYVLHIMVNFLPSLQRRFRSRH